MYTFTLVIVIYMNEVPQYTIILCITARIMPIPS